jgi:hypothetical protein
VRAPRAAPRAWTARDRARGHSGGELAHSKNGRACARGNPPHHPAAARITAAAHGGGGQGTSPGSSPHTWSPQPRRECANGAILPARSLLKRARSPSRPSVTAGQPATGQGDQAHVHAKTTLTVIFRRFDPASVGRMARTGLSLPGASSGTPPRSETSRTAQLSWQPATSTTNRRLGNQA